MPVCTLAGITQVKIIMGLFQWKLTLNMLNHSKDHKRYIHILNPILDLASPKLAKLNLEQQYVLSVLYSQYHACWCDGDLSSQCISRHGIVSQTQAILSVASEELRCCATSIGISIKDKAFLWLSYLYNGRPYTLTDGLYIETGPSLLFVTTCTCPRLV